MSGSEGPLVLDAFGVRWRFDVSGLDDGAPDALSHRLRALWRRAAVADDGPGAAGPVEPFVVARDGGTVRIQGDPYDVSDEELPYAVSRALTVASIARRLGDCLLLHAAGVSTEDGRTVAFVAPSGTGKTTAARTLGQHFGYVTDETVAVEDDLVVRAYPKPLSVVVDPASPHDKAESSPDEEGLRATVGVLRLTSVVVLDRDPEVAAPTLAPAGLVEAAVDVVPQSSALLKMADPMGALARALTVGGGPWRLTYAEIGGCVELVEQLAQGRDVGPERAWTAERGPAADDPVDVVPELPPGTDGVEIGPSTRIRRARWRHALHAEGSSLVLAGSLPIGMPGMASTVWRTALGPMTVAELTAAAVAAHGDHPDAGGVVVATVRQLLASGAFVLDEPQA